MHGDLWYVYLHKTCGHLACKQSRTPHSPPPQKKHIPIAGLGILYTNPYIQTIFKLKSPSIIPDNENLYKPKNSGYRLDHTKAIVNQNQTIEQNGIFFSIMQTQLEWKSKTCNSISYAPYNLSIWISISWMHQI